MNENDSLITGWRSSKYGDIIPFNRVICVKAGATKGSLVIRLEDDNCVTVFPDEADAFSETFMIYLHAAQALELQVITDDDLPIQTKKRLN